MLLSGKCALDFPRRFVPLLPRWRMQSTKTDFNHKICYLITLTNGRKGSISLHCRICWIFPVETRLENGVKSRKTCCILMVHFALGLLLTHNPHSLPNLLYLNDTFDQSPNWSVPKKLLWIDFFKFATCLQFDLLLNPF